MPRRGVHAVSGALADAGPARRRPVGGQQQQLAIGRALVTRPKLLLLDESTEGIQPSIIKEIGRAIVFLKESTGMAILLVEQYLDFCREIADHVHVMDRGDMVHPGEGKLVHAEDMRLEGAISDTLARPAVLAGHRTMASVVYCGEDAETHLEGARGAIGEAGGASAFAGTLVARIATADGMALRRALVPLIASLRGGSALPRVWAI